MNELIANLVDEFKLFYALFDNGFDFFALGDVATDRLIFDQFLLAIEDSAIGPLMPGNTAVWQNHAQFVCADGIARR